MMFDVRPQEAEYVIALFGVFFLGFQWYIQEANCYLPVFALFLIAVCIFYAVVVERKPLDSKVIETHYAWKFRSNATPGGWCCVLIPAAMFASQLCSCDIRKDQYELTLTVAALVTMMSSMIVAHEGYLAKKRSATRRRFDIPLPVLHLVPTLIALTIIYIYDIGIPIFPAMVAFQALYIKLLTELPSRMPNSFSLGEAMVVTQALALFLFSTFTQALHKRHIVTFYHYEEYQDPKVTLVSQIAVLSIILVVTILYSCKLFHKTVWFYTLLVVVNVLGVLPLLWYCLEENPALWLCYFIIDTKTRMCLFLYWLCASVVAGLIVRRYSAIPDKRSAEEKQTTQEKEGMSTIIRKYFHFVVVAVYVPGLLLDQEFLFLASVIAMVAFILLECIRILKIKPFGERLQESFQAFVDEKDSGCVILTHIYLLAGSSLPMWLYNLNNNAGASIVVFSGVVSIGVGDTAASMFGTWLGAHKWPGTKKSVEGTVAACTFQLLACVLLSLLGVQPPILSLTRYVTICIIVLVTSLLEAFTSQIDNLVLPLYMYGLLATLR